MAERMDSDPSRPRTGVRVVAPGDASFASHPSLRTQHYDAVGAAGTGLSSAHAVLTSTMRRRLARRVAGQPVQDLRLAFDATTSHGDVVRADAVVPYTSGVQTGSSRRHGGERRGPIRIIESASRGHRGRGLRAASVHHWTFESQQQPGGRVGSRRTSNVCWYQRSLR